MLHVCFACGLRVSELVGLQLEQVSLRRPASIRVRGKGRKERSLPLWKETTTDLRAWLAVRGTVRVPEVFVNVEGAAMTRAGFDTFSISIPAPALPDVRDWWVAPCRPISFGTVAR